MALSHVLSAHPQGFPNWLLWVMRFFLPPSGNYIPETLEQVAESCAAGDQLVLVGFHAFRAAYLWRLAPRLCGWHIAKTALVFGFCSIYPIHSG